MTPTAPPPSTAGVPSASTSAAPSERVRLRRKRERGHYDREVIDAILDEALFAHLGIADEQGQPFVVPTLHARRDDVVYCHGSLGSRTMQGSRAGSTGVPDGLADRRPRAGALGDAPFRQLSLGDAARAGTSGDRAGREDARRSRRSSSTSSPAAGGRCASPTENELAATAVLCFPIEEASAKVRSGGPIDDEPDLEREVWAGVLPLASATGAPEPDALMDPAIPLPSYLSPYRRARRRVTS